MSELWWSGLALSVVAPLALLVPVLSALLERSGPIRLRHWAEEAGGGLRELYDSAASFESFRLLLSLSARLLPLALLGALWRVLEGSGAAAAPLLAAAVVGLTLIAVEWTNRWLVGLHSEDALERLTIVFRLAYGLLRPATWLLRRMIPTADPDEAEDDEDEASDEEIDAYIDVGVREGILEPEEEEMVRSVVDFGDSQVRSVMTPRVEITSVPVEAEAEQLAATFFESKHSRLPVYRGSVDRIVGILHIRDLFEALHHGAAAGAEQLSKPPHFVPETKGLPELLQQLQELHQQMAIVVDEYGGVAGLVTVEDLVEEIVGEIADEHEEREEVGERLDGGRWRLEGRTELEDLGELFEVDLDDLPYETVSGLVCGELGYVPKAGETYHSHGLEVIVEAADERRVTSVAVGRTAGHTTEDAT